MSVEIFEHNQLITIRYFDVVSLDDVINAYQQLVGLPSFDSSPVMLVDCTDIKSIDYEPVNFEEHATISRAASKMRRYKSFEVAIAVESKDVLEAIFELNKRFKSLQPDWTRHIFGDRDEAYAWAIEKIAKHSP